MSSAPLRLLVIAHTHWDREWYRPAGRFRQRLVALVDELLDDPPAPRESFLLDGQAIVLDDYLAVRPERAAEIGALLRERRLEAGPWYVLADNLIPGGEALVRNLLAGRDALQRLRSDAPPVLYCPDAFGHPAILPDLAAGFGCDVAVVWRGYGGARWPDADTVRWRGPGGGTVLLHHLPPDGYEFGGGLPADPDAAALRWARTEAVLRPRSTLGVSILLNGADHHARQRHHADAFRALAIAAAPDVVTPTTLRAASASLVLAARRVEIPEVSGELRDSYGYTWTLQGTLAARAAQKRRNATLERALVRDVEPWIALTDDRGGAAPALLAAAWRTLLEGHPHDTLCGTSIDAVALALDGRHADVAPQIDGLRADALAALLGHDAERARHSQQGWSPVVVVRNRAARPRGGIVELSLAATIADVAVGPGSATRQGARRATPPWRVEGMPLQILGRGEGIELTESPRDYPDADLVSTVRALGWARPLGGYCVETHAQSGRAVRAGEMMPAPVTATASATGEIALDNGFVRVDVAADGAVRMTDRLTTRVVEHALALEDARDAGDLYTPAIRETLPVPAADRVRLVHRGPLRGEISIGYRLSSAQGRSTCRITLGVDAGARFVRIAVSGHNAAPDHRLRLRVATGLAGARTLADAAFHPVDRAPLTMGADDATMESVVTTAPLHRYVSRFTVHAGATLFSDGLAEYESLDDGSIAVTLLRAVGALSRADLPERPGHAGWPADTPLAQCIGPYESMLALALHGVDSEEQRDEIERMADDALLPLVGETLRSNLDAPHATAGLELEGDGLAFSAAMPGRTPGWIVLRCVNRRARAVTGAWRVGRAVHEAWYARLDETRLAPLVVDEKRIDFEAAGGAIVTILARVGPP